MYKELEEFGGNGYVRESDATGKGVIEDKAEHYHLQCTSGVWFSNNYEEAKASYFRDTTPLYACPVLCNER